MSQYRALSLLRRVELALSRGWFCFIWSDVNVFAYLRELDGLNKAFLVVLNFGKDTTTDLSSVSELPDTLTVHLSTVSISQKTLSKSRIPTSQGQGLLLEYSTNQRFHPNHASECYVSEKACYLPAIDILYKCWRNFLEDVSWETLWQRLSIPCFISVVSCWLVPPTFKSNWSKFSVHIIVIRCIICVHCEPASCLAIKTVFVRWPFIQKELASM